MQSPITSCVTDIRCAVILELITENPGTINISYDFELPDHLNDFAFTIIDGWNNIRTKGFDIDGRTCKWTGEQDTSPSVEIEFAVDDGPGVTGYVDTGDWAVTRLPNLSWQWQYNSSGLAPQIVDRYRVSGKGIISTDGAIAYLGPHEEFVDTAPTTGEKFRLVVPDDAALHDDPTSILSALTGASELLEISALNDSVLAIAAPTGEHRWASKGRQRGDSGFWVRDDAVTHETNETWVHEYVHTRQLFQRTNETYWFKEGTADYFASLAALNRGDVGFKEFHRFLTPRADTGAILANPDTWSSTSTAYRQGRRTCAALDLRIREITDGNSTLQDIVARLNTDRDAEGLPELSNQTISTAIKKVTGEDMWNWFEEYVCAAKVPSVANEREAFYIGTENPETGFTPTSPSNSRPETTPAPDPDPEIEPSSEPTPKPEPVRSCPICGTDTADRLCPTCGHELKEEPTGERPTTGDTKACPTCGTETIEQFCPTCGHEFQNGSGSMPPRADSEICPVCETETEADLCPTCGHDMAPRCPECDAVGTPHDNHCTTCGQELRS